jgi:hypothetical protein
MSLAIIDQKYMNDKISTENVSKYLHATTPIANPASSLKEKITTI